MTQSFFSPSYFFDLEDLLSKDLFLSSEYVWEVLPLISSFLKTLPLGQQNSYIPHTAHLSNASQIYIGKDVIIEPGAYIRGPCYISDGCQIRHGAYIRGDVILEKYSVVGHDSELKNAILMKHAQAAHFAYVGDSILGNKVNLGAGVKCANLKLNHQGIKIKVPGEEPIQTGLRKFGAIIGDRSQLGCNSVTNPGTLIGQDVFVNPCLNFGGLIHSKSTVRGTSLVEILH